MAIFMLSRNLADRHLFTFHDDNGDVVLTSRHFADRAAAEAGVESLRAMLNLNTGLRCHSGARGEHWFTLTGPDGEALAESARYNDEAARDSAIRRVRESGPLAKLTYSRRS